MDLSGHYPNTNGKNPRNRLKRGLYICFAVTSPRGFPLGEHRRIGECDQALYGELLHVPVRTDAFAWPRR